MTKNGEKRAKREKAPQEGLLSNRIEESDVVCGLRACLRYTYSHENGLIITILKLQLNRTKRKRLKTKPWIFNILQFKEWYFQSKYRNKKKNDNKEEEYNEKTLKELKEIGKSKGIKNTSKMNKNDLIEMLIKI